MWTPERGRYLIGNNYSHMESMCFTKIINHCSQSSVKFPRISGSMFYFYFSNKIKPNHRNFSINYVTTKSLMKILLLYETLYIEDLKYFCLFDHLFIFRYAVIVSNLLHCMSCQ